MRRALGLVFVLVLLLPGAGSLRTSGSSPAAVPAFPPGNFVAFVDTEIVDLMWTDVPGAQSYRLYRGGGATGETLPTEMINGKRFSRVIATPSGADTSYKICAVMGNSSEDCSSWENVHHEWVKGTLYKDREWATVDFQLDGVVQIMDGAKLTITFGATVSSMPSPSAAPVILTMPNGHLVIGGEGPAVAVSNIRIEHNSADSATSRIQGKEGNRVRLAGVHVEMVQPMMVQYCELISSSTIAIPAGTFATAADLSHNVFENSRIMLRGGKANIAFNEFKGLGWAIIDLAGSEASIEKNDIALGATVPGIKVWPDTGGKVSIKDNVFRPQSASEKWGYALWLRASDIPSPTDPPTGAGAPEVLVEGNLIQNCFWSVTIDGKITVEMRKNSVVGNLAGIGAGVDVDGSGLVIKDNCIVGNNPGLGSGPGVDASQNWWGSSLGPRTNSGTPRGAGDIVSGGAQYKPFLDKSNCDVRARNLSVLSIEATQAIQNSANSVPLVEGKPTRVRVYLASATGETPPVSGELTVHRGAEKLGTISSSRAGRAIHPAADSWVLRSDINNSLVFKLPTGWATGTISLTAVVNTDYSYEEVTHDDNEKTIAVTFRKRRPVHTGLIFVPPLEKQFQAGAAVGPESLLQMGELFRKIYPSHEVAYSLLPSIHWPHEMVEPGPYTDYGKNGALLHSALGVSHMRLQAEGGWAGQSIDQVYGAFPEGAYASADPTRYGGRGTSGFGRSNLLDFNRVLASNLGIYAVYSGSPQGSSEDCGYGIGEFGYDVVAERLMPASSASFLYPDYVSCPEPYPRWIGPDNYQALFDYNDSAALAQEVTSPDADPQTYLLISGVVEREPVTDNRLVEFLPVWQATGAVAPLNPPVGTEYCLEVQDAAHAVLASHCFDLGFQWGERSWIRHLGFQVALPLTGSPARVVMRRGGEIGSIAVSANPPVVNISSNQVQSVAGSLAVSWSGSDSDGDSLAYSVQYSADNQATWLPAASNITGNSYTLNLDEVPGGTQCWVRVQASDGFHTTSAVQGPFVVEDHAPLVSISNPEARSVTASDPTLSGYAYDMEEGELGGGDMVWTSSIDGQLGTGTLVYATGLTTGTHTLTLTATDGQGHSASKAVTIYVNTAPDLYSVFLPAVLKSVP